MLKSIINYSIQNKVIVLLFVAALIMSGIYALLNIPIGAVPDVTNNQVQVITTSRDLSTQDVERYLTYPVELEMANLPGVQEIRSISKFGLSVVTIVFDDDMGTYLPRQLISERLKYVADQIPEGFGTPEMGPISTGLGEIYQYVLDVKPEHADKYTVTELRTIQDWIVKRQLSGIPGVVEVNTWGGFLKTYEVGIDPKRLQSLDISLQQVYHALESNNSVAGGGYIEKTNEAFFIRSEGLVSSIEDIENIVVANKSGVPILIRDLATIGIGAATRFGAITGNGEGEKILGQVMMLKGADSKKVINNVIERVDQVQQSLPLGVFINPFLERSDLIGRTTFTIAENLILGFLIVLFVVVFLLGNIRSGLVVASVIPLTLLFALTAMYIFGVDANLMSLGAIDFGIIIDGAVIIVEYITFLLTKNASQFLGISGSETRIRMDRIVGEGASKMMHSAAFGQVIIIIVFIPVLALAGVEGKMFRPMALTFCFALIGALILCLTYVPVMSALFLKPSFSSKPNMATRFIEGIKKVYRPILESAFRFKVVVLVIAVILFIGTSILFTRMGGEFVPTLDEGDFVIQPVLKVGMSLAETVKMTTRIEKICLRFPEVKQVVSRIGAAEVPTDPMSLEESDVIITLKDKKEWTSATSKDELADVIKEALLDEIPGVEIEFTQPIEMRFNELISGVSSDLAIKIFGEDLNVLYRLANDVETEVKNIEGVGDISVEKIDGLPQMSVIYDRAKIAKYGLSISELNDLVSIGFAGRSAGVIFEGERQFDLVLRYDAANRQDLVNLKQALVDLPNGQKLPLSEFAEIKYSTGPAMISRDNTKRRVVIGINVRNRDLQSVVDEVQNTINQGINIPSGYHITYGGQFENLEKASHRLLVAVPVALALIFVLLYFAFHSVQDALLIYSGIPLATIGGVLLLYLRDLPFSISAGIGFIALFAIAVLNGIVMIEHFKDLKSTNMDDPDDIIIQGAIDRIRPVLLTAIAAALGFLPMAISTSAGAEVQRPLATVVIGGLISATLLTLVVLPVLYSVFRSNALRSNSKTGATILVLILCLGHMPAQSQEELSMDDVVSIVLEKSSSLQSANLFSESAAALVDASKQIRPTNFGYEFDRNNLTDLGNPLHVFGVNQSFPWAGVNEGLKNLQISKADAQKAFYDLESLSVAGEVALKYDQLRYLQSLQIIHIEIDSIYFHYLDAVNRKLELGASTMIEKLTAEQKLNESRRLLQDVTGRSDLMYLELAKLMKREADYSVVSDPYMQLDFESIGLDQNPIWKYGQTRLNITEQELIVAKNEALPEWNLGVFAGATGFRDFSIYPGIQAGISVPLNKKHFQIKENANKLLLEAEMKRLDQVRITLENEVKLKLAKLKNINGQLSSYDANTKAISNKLIEVALSAYMKNEINYFEYIRHVDESTQIKLNELALIHEFNQTAIELKYNIK